MVFISISTVIFIVIAVFMPKRMTKLEIYTTINFVITLVVIIDTIIDLKYNKYGYIAPGVQLYASMIQITIYPALSTIMLNFFPIDSSIKAKVFYILGWSLFSTFFEYLSLKSGFLYYNGWKLWYSLLAYPIIFLVMVLNLYCIKKLKKIE